MAATATPPVEQNGHELNEALEAHVQRMLQSPHFARAETQRRLLAYLWEHRSNNINEYAIATEALGRNDSFDPTVDASVRVHISRLRRKLKDYYQHEPAEPELLVIPTGTHQLMVIDHQEHTETLPALITEPQLLHPIIELPYRRNHLVHALLGLCLALTLAVGLLGWMVFSGRQQRVATTPAVPPKPNVFWTSFLAGSAPIKIILPTPVFFGFHNAPTIRLRSTRVNDFHDFQTDPKLAELAKELGPPALEQSYTVTSDTLAAIDMARYLDSVGAKQRVSFDVSRDSSLVILEQANVIAVGTHQTLEPLAEYLQAMNFSLAPNETRVINAYPRPGEQASYEIVSESPTRMVRPSIVALLPGRAPGLKLLMLQSRDTSAMISLLSTTAGSNLIEEMLKKNGNPQFFEMVVGTELENDRPLRSWPIAIHAFSSQPPPSRSM